MAIGFCFSDRKLYLLEVLADFVSSSFLQEVFCVSVFKKFLSLLILGLVFDFNFITTLDLFSSYICITSDF